MTDLAKAYCFSEKDAASPLPRMIHETKEVKSCNLHLLEVTFGNGG
jgi:nitrous oxide reductase accessory protein NosL